MDHGAFIDAADIEVSMSMHTQQFYSGFDHLLPACWHLMLHKEAHSYAHSSLQAA